MRGRMGDHQVGLPGVCRTMLAVVVVSAVSLACSGDDLGDAIDAARQAAGQPEVGQPSTAPLEEREMRLTSSAFGPGEAIPRRFTCDGSDVSPPLALMDIPEGTASLVLVMDDPDAPGSTWDHWVAYDIPVRSDIAADSGSIGTSGRNSWGRSGYGGPCPPRGAHRYVFTAYALDSKLGLEPGADKGRVLKALKGHILAEARLIGRYERASG